AVAAASSLTGTRFNLLVASSLVATAAIVASGLASSGDNGALAALLGQRPSQTATVAGPAKSPPASAESAGASTSAESAPAVPSEPLASAEPSAVPSKPPPAKQPAPPTESLPEAGRIKHVFVISLASSGYDAAFGATEQMPYLAGTLRPEGELLSGYALLDDAALPNQIAAISGQPPNAQTEQNCPKFEECLFPVETATLADQLTAGRFKWRGYMEGMVDETGKPDTCVQPDPAGAEEPPLGGYATRNNPFVYFHSLLDLGDCALNDVSLDQLDADLSKLDSTPNYALISPNLCNAGVTGQCPEGAPSGAASADAFLSQWVPKILASPAYEKDGLLIIAFGELNPPDPTSATPAPAGPPKVGALLVSRFVSPGATDPAAYDPYSLLRTIEDLFGLDHLGLADGAKVKSLAPGLLGETRGD
ncbi:MAG TPA: alkaline phosphatase family protein, partial [Solirubrobacterales bacterium]|nr:alkaline phosphatase family protein [Solirubrobacterales bacterium]